MLHVDDDNNDPLFRKAAEDFFLPADAPDWDHFFDKMSKETGLPAADNTIIKNKKKHRFLSLIFTWFYNRVIQGKYAGSFKMMSSFWPGKTKKKINPLFYKTPVFAVI